MDRISFDPAAIALPDPGPDEDDLIPAAERALALPELLDLILGNLSAREAIVLQRVNRAFSQSVSSATHLEKRMILSKRRDDEEMEMPGTNGKMMKPLNRFPTDEIWHEPEWFPAGYIPDGDTRYPSTFTTGFIYDSFIVGIHARTKLRPKQAISRNLPLSIVKTIPWDSPRHCTLHIRWRNAALVGQLRRLEGYPYPRLESACIMAAVDVDPTRSGVWLDVADAVAGMEPTVEEWLQYADQEHCRRKVSMTVSKDLFSPFIRHHFRSDPVYMYFRAEFGEMRCRFQEDGVLDWLATKPKTTDLQAPECCRRHKEARAKIDDAIILGVYWFVAVLVLLNCVRVAWIGLTMG